mmetsp:Transcript_3005/g.4814  ORF Transcript_3005/g.4814 Transcript_3005/m.4814 type:complete len:361 (+) Transcript_3005:82-1164(+)
MEKINDVSERCSICRQSRRDDVLEGGRHQAVDRRHAAEHRGAADHHAVHHAERRGHAICRRAGDRHASGRHVGDQSHRDHHGDQSHHGRRVGQSHRGRRGGVAHSDRHAAVCMCRLHHVDGRRSAVRRYHVDDHANCCHQPDAMPAPDDHHGDHRVGHRVGHHVDHRVDRSGRGRHGDRRSEGVRGVAHRRRHVAQPHASGRDAPLPRLLSLRDVRVARSRDALALDEWRLALSWHAPPTAAVRHALANAFVSPPLISRTLRPNVFVMLSGCYQLRLCNAPNEISPSTVLDARLCVARAPLWPAFRRTLDLRRFSWPTPRATNQSLLDDEHVPNSWLVLLRPSNELAKLRVLLAIWRVSR